MDRLFFSCSLKTQVISLPRLLRKFGTRVSLGQVTEKMVFLKTIFSDTCPKKYLLRDAEGGEQPMSLKVELSLSINRLVRNSYNHF